MNTVSKVTKIHKTWTMR